MLTHPTHASLVALGLTGMARALEDQQRQPDIAALAFDERLALLVDREATERDNKRLISRLRFASLRQNAVVEDIDVNGGWLKAGGDLFHADLIALESEKKQDSGASVLQKIVIEAERHKPEAG